MQIIHILSAARTLAAGVPSGAGVGCTYSSEEGRENDSLIGDPGDFGRGSDPALQLTPEAQELLLGAMDGDPILSVLPPPQVRFAMEWGSGIWCQLDI